jgi:hypothetical protein
VYCFLQVALCIVPLKLLCELFHPSCCVYCSIQVALCFLLSKLLCVQFPT